jgi:hypothetical protein
MDGPGGIKTRLEGRGTMKPKVFEITAEDLRSMLARIPEDMRIVFSNPNGAQEYELWEAWANRVKNEYHITLEPKL